MRYTRRQWGTVLFTDESKFNVSRSDGRKRVYRATGERFNESCVLKSDRWGGGSIHVWAGITTFHRTDLVILNRNVNAQTYVDDVLHPVAIPFLRRHFPRGQCIYQHDNAPAHRARLTNDFLQQNNVRCMDWPALSPDMAPIEHIWDELGRRVYARTPKPRNLHELRQALVQEWANIPQRRIAAVTLSMRRICTALIDANGSYTRY